MRAPRIVSSGRMSANEYHYRHDWVRSKLGKPSLCDECGTTEASMFDWANISGEYKRDLADWRRLCRPCHSQFDKKRDYWRDEYCAYGHKMVLTNLYLHHDKKLISGRFIECRTCRQASRDKYNQKGKIRV